MKEWKDGTYFYNKISPYDSCLSPLSHVIAFEWERIQKCTGCYSWQNSQQSKSLWHFGVKTFVKKTSFGRRFYPKWPYCLSRDDVWLQERLSVKTTQFKSAPHISYCILWDQKTWEIMHISSGCFLNCPFMEKSCIQMSFLVLCGKTWQHGFGMTYGGVNNDSSFIFVWTTLLNCAMSCLLRGKA